MIWHCNAAPNERINKGVSISKYVEIQEQRKCKSLKHMKQQQQRQKQQ